MLVLTDRNFKEEITNSNIPVLVDFWAPWCGPCKMIAPVLEELSGDVKNKIIIAKVNVDENPKAAGDFEVSAIPTLILFKGGQEINRHTGFADKSKLISFLKTNGIDMVEQ